MIVKLLTKHRLEILSLKVGCRGSSESTHVKMPHCWKSHAMAHIWYLLVSIPGFLSSLFNLQTTPHIRYLLVSIPGFLSTLFTLISTP